MKQSFRRIQRLVLATTLVTPTLSRAQELQIIVPMVFDPPTTDRDHTGCRFGQINEANPLQSMTTFVQDKTTLDGSQFKAGQVRVMFRDGAKFVINNGEIQNLPGTTDAAKNEHREDFPKLKRAAVAAMKLCKTALGVSQL